MTSLKNEAFSQEDLLSEIDELKERLAESEQTLSAIRNGEVDAFLISTDSGEQVYTLKGADEPYRIFLEQMNEGAVTISESGEILYSNQSFARSMRAPLGKIIGVDFLNFVHSSNITVFKHLLDGSINGPVRDEILFNAKDGTRIPMILSINFLTATGEPIYCIILSDLTERVLAEDALKKANEKLENRVQERTKELSESENRFRALVSASSDVLYRMSPDWGEMLQMNSQSFLASTEKANRDWLQEYIPPEEQPRVLATINEAILTKSVFELEHRVFEADGSVGWTHSRAVPVLDANGQIIEWFGEAREITARVSAEEALRESEAKYRGLFENVHEGVSLRRLIYDEKGDIVEAVLIEANPAALSVYNASSIEELRGKRYEEMASPKMKAQALDLVRKMKALGGSITEEEYSDINDRDYLVTVTPIENDLVITTSADITDLRQAQNEVEEARSRAELYLDLLSHDVNNYNAAAMGYLQLAETRLKLNDKDKKLIIKPLEGLSNSTELIANVRDIQKLEEGSKTHELVDVCNMLRKIKEEYQSPVGREVTIVLEEDEHCSVRASNLLRSVFSNIVSNAVKHSTGPVNIIMTLGSEAVDGRDHVRVSIEDNGPGIPDDKKDNIFARSLRGLSRRTGHGLGLYLVKRIVEDHGGRVWVEDRVPGDHTQGAKFIVLLPIS